MIVCSDNVKLGCHRTFLSSRSTVFDAMMRTDMLEARQGFVIISDFNSTTFNEVLRYIYCNYVSNIDHHADQLIFAAEKYQLLGLKAICITNLKSTLTIQNLFQRLRIATLVISPSLFSSCIRFIRR